MLLCGLALIEATDYTDKEGTIQVMPDDKCLFCRIVYGEVPATLVYVDPHAIAFLDHRPLFHGHTLLVPREHFETLTDLPSKLIGPLFNAAQSLAAAVQHALGAPHRSGVRFR